ncbi:hypothetical protein E4T56_gene5253, partial [Termitomyces sp. T112]
MPRHQARDRLTIAHRLAQRHNVGIDAMALETPHMAAGAAKAGLHFVRNENAARAADRLDGALQEAGLFRQDAVAGEDRIHDQHGRLDAMALEIGNGGLHIAGEAPGNMGAAAIGGRRRHRADMGAQRDRCAKGRRELRDGIGNAVIGGFGDDDARAARAHLGNAIGQIIRLAARAGQHHVRQIGLYRRQQTFGKFEDGFMQIARVRAQRGDLPGDGFHHIGMTMAQRDHVVVRVEIAAAVGIIEPDALAPHKMKRLLIHQPIGRAQQAAALLDHMRFVGVQFDLAGDEGVDGGAQLPVCLIAGEAGDMVQPGPGKAVVAHDIFAIFRITGGAPFGDQNGNHEPRGDKVEQNRLLCLVQRQHLVKASDNLGGAEQGIGPVGHLIGGRRRDFPHQRGMEYIAKVDDRGNLVGIVRVHQHIAKIIVIMDDLRPQGPELRQSLGLIPRHEALHQPAARWISDTVDHAGQTVGRRDIPQYSVPGGRMRKAFKRLIQSAKGLAKGPALRRRPSGLTERHSGQECQHAQDRSPPVIEHDRHLIGSVKCGHGTRHRQARGMTGQMIENAGLQIDNIAGFGGIRNFQKI